MYIPTIALLSLLTLTLADNAAKTSSLGLTTKPTSKLLRRDLPTSLNARQSCSGTCQTCFGSGYTECPADSSLCYEPATGPGSSACMGSGGSGGSGGGGGSGSGVPDVCTQRGATCASCFGPGNIDCPAGSRYDCYNPAEGSVEDRCTDSSGSPGSPTSSAAGPTGTGAASSQCVAQFGAGSVLCGTDTCYNPGEGDVCCADGSHCENNSQCVLDGGEYKCDRSGSGGAGGAGGSGSASSSGIIISTRSSSSFFSATSRETRTRTSSATGAAQTTEDTINGAGRVEVGMGMAVLAGFAALL